MTSIQYFMRHSSSLLFRSWTVPPALMWWDRAEALYCYPNMIIWNPSTGAPKQILYSHLLATSPHQWSMIGSSMRLCGIGYDASKDDYLVVWYWIDYMNNHKDHFYLFSVRTNSWIKLEVSLPKTLIAANVRGFGVFLKGAFHWLVCNSDIGDDCYVLVFDLNNKCFLEISLPKRMSITDNGSIMELGGCLLALHCCNEIWVLENYYSSSCWVLYGTSSRDSFRPLGLCNSGDIIGFDSRTRGFCIHNHDDEYCSSFQLFSIGVGGYTVYTESFISLPT